MRVCVCVCFNFLQVRVTRKISNCFPDALFPVLAVQRILEPSLSPSCSHASLAGAGWGGGGGVFPQGDSASSPLRPPVNFLRGTDSSRDDLDTGWSGGT